MRQAVLFIVVLICSNNSIAQRNWTYDDYDHGKVRVRYEILKTDQDALNVFYIAEAEARLSLTKAETFMRDAKLWKNFLEHTEDCFEVGRSSENNWVTHFRVSPPWPMPDSDLVQSFTFYRLENGFKIVGTARPDQYPKADVDRMTFSDATYYFTDLGDGKVKVKFEAAFSPIGSAPKWMLNAWFPGGPGKMVTRLIQEIQNR